MPMKNVHFFIAREERHAPVNQICLYTINLINQGGLTDESKINQVRFAGHIMLTKVNIRHDVS